MTYLSGEGSRPHGLSDVSLLDIHVEHDGGGQLVGDGLLAAFAGRRLHDVDGIPTTTLHIAITFTNTLLDQEAASKALFQVPQVDRRSAAFVVQLAVGVEQLVELHFQGT